MFEIFIKEILTATLWLSVVLVFFYFINKIASKKDLTKEIRKRAKKVKDKYTKNNIFIAINFI